MPLSHICSVGMCVGDVVGLWLVGDAVGSLVGSVVGMAVGLIVLMQLVRLLRLVTKPSKQAQKTAFEPSLCGTNEQYVD